MISVKHSPQQTISILSKTLFQTANRTISMIDEGYSDDSSNASDRISLIQLNEQNMPSSDAASDSEEETIKELKVVEEGKELKESNKLKEPKVELNVELKVEEVNNETKEEEDVSV